MRGEGLETVRKVGWWGRTGSGGIAFSGGSPSFTARQTTQWQKQAFPKEPDFQLLGAGYINTDKPSPGTPLGVPRLQTWQTSLPMVPISEYTKRQTTPHIKPSSGTLHRVYKWTDYIKMDKSSPGVRLGAPGGRLQTCRQAFSWPPF